MTERVLTLRKVRQQTIDALYELKALKDKPICRLVDEIVTEYFETNPAVLAMRQEEVRRIAREYGGADDEFRLHNFRRVIG
jgi:hypothetical protein